jgi:hypothetical protein
MTTAVNQRRRDSNSQIFESFWEIFDRLSVTKITERLHILHLHLGKLQVGLIRPQLRERSIMPATAVDFNLAYAVSTLLELTMIM